MCPFLLKNSPSIKYETFSKYSSIKETKIRIHSKRRIIFRLAKFPDKVLLLKLFMLICSETYIMKIIYLFIWYFRQVCIKTRGEQKNELLFKYVIQNTMLLFNIWNKMLMSFLYIWK